MSPDSLYAGVDVGTSSLCGVVLDLESGSLIFSKTIQNRAVLKPGCSWENLQDPDFLVSDARGLLEEMLSETAASGRRMGAIGVTGQMHGILYVDSAGRAVSPLYTWLDGRAAQPAPSGGTCAQELSSKTGFHVAPGFGTATHYYNMLHGQVPEAASVLCTIMDYLVCRLTGAGRPASDPTNAASLGLFDLHAGSFDFDAARGAGIDPEIFPLVTGSGSPAGSTAAGIPVCTAIGDNQASFLGGVQDPLRTLHLNIGTGGQVSAYSPEIEICSGLDTRPFPGGGSLLVGALICGGRAWALLAEFLHQCAELFSGRSIDLAEVYRVMGDLAHTGMTERGQDGGPLAGRSEQGEYPLIGMAGPELQVDTRFQGTRTDPDRRGSISNISPTNFTPGNLATGFLYGIAGEMYAYFQLMPGPLRERITLLAGSGNGVRRNPGLRRALAHRFERPVRIPRNPEEAAIGAALSAAVGTGRISGFLRAGAFVAHR
jgi:sedoheptulokinase